MSRRIRSAIKNKRDDFNQANLERNLLQKFWSTCHDIFNKATNSLPTFSIFDGDSYFRNVLSATNFRRFIIPSWIPRLDQPRSPFDESPPTYKEVATLIRKARRGASAGPMDQLSIIILQKCPMARTILHLIICECWRSRRIPECWKRSATILIYKKGDTSDPGNFRPITLQAVWYKILASLMKTRLYAFLDSNDYLDKKKQKGFWPKQDGVDEHTEMLTHIMRDSKKHSRGLVVTLLDLKNAFGEVNHNLIRAALAFHHVPDSFVQLFNNIYSEASTSISIGNKRTKNIPVNRGVLQGDPCSPLLFNLCFNTLMLTLNKPDLNKLGTIWGPKESMFQCSWLQFADDAAIISNSVKNTQQLLDIFKAWCEWSGMIIRLDKCCTFGMLKIDGHYQQYEPAIFLNHGRIPTVAIGSSFTYLSKIFNFEMKKKEAKEQLLTRLRKLLKITSDLPIRPQLKLNILKRYIYSNLIDDLKKYAFGATWIRQNMDSECCSHVRDWLGLPPSACLKEVLTISKSKCGFGIPSIEETSEKLKIKGRFRLKNNSNKEFHQIWQDTSNLNANLDRIVVKTDQFRMPPDLWMPPSNRRLRTISSLLKSRELQRKSSTKTSAGTTSACGTRSWIACLRFSSDSLEKLCSRCYLRTPILLNGKVQQVRVAAYVEVRVRRTNTCLRIVRQPSNGSRLVTITHWWRLLTGSRESSPRTALSVWILTQTFSIQSTEYSNTRSDPTLFCLMHLRLLSWNWQFVMSQISWRPGPIKWTNMQITISIWILSLISIWLNYSLLKFLCWDLYQIWPIFVIFQVSPFFHAISKVT